MTLMAQILAIFVLILCGSLERGHLSGAGRPGNAAVAAAARRGAGAASCCRPAVAAAHGCSGAAAHVLVLVAGLAVA